MVDERKGEFKQLTLRLDRAVFNIVKENAAHNRRSTGKEIEYALFRYYKELEIRKNSACTGRAHQY